MYQLKFPNRFIVFNKHGMQLPVPLAQTDKNHYV